MKLVTWIWSFCLTVSLGSFGVMMFEDRKLGVPLPYSVPLAFTGTLALAAALFAIAQALLARRPVQVVKAPRPIERARTERLTPRAAEGVVLLDCSRPAAGRAA